MELPFASRRSLTQAFELVIDITASSGVGDLQRRFVRTVTALVGADLHGIYVFGEGQPAPVTTDAAPSGFLREYEARGRAGDPLLAYLREKHEPVHERALFTARGWQRVPLCDVMHSWDLEHSLQGPLYVGDRLVGTINFARARGTRAFGDADVRIARWLCQQVSDAYQRVSNQQLAQLRGACLDVIAPPVVATGADGRVLVANDAARDHLQPFAASELRPGFAAAVASNLAALKDTSQRFAESRSSPAGLGETGARVRTRRLPGFAEHYASTFTPAPRDSRDPGGADILSLREQQVATLVAEGHTNEQIAAHLVLSPNTVKGHLKSIHRKLGVSRRTEVALWANRHLGA